LRCSPAAAEQAWLGGQQDYANHTEAMNDIADYIVSFYNSQRLHSKLGNLPPNAFGQKSSIKQAIGLCEKTRPGQQART
jgi:putative transposase